MVLGMIVAPTGLKVQRDRNGWYFWNGTTWEGDRRTGRGFASKGMAILAASQS